MNAKQLYKRFDGMARDEDYRGMLDIALAGNADENRIMQAVLKVRGMLQFDWLAHRESIGGLQAESPKRIRNKIANMKPRKQVDEAPQIAIVPKIEAPTANSIHIAWDGVNLSQRAYPIVSQSMRNDKLMITVDMTVCKYTMYASDARLLSQLDAPIAKVA